ARGFHDAVLDNFPDTVRLLFFASETAPSRMTPVGAHSPKRHRSELSRSARSTPTVASFCNQVTGRQLPVDDMVMRCTICGRYRCMTSPGANWKYSLSGVLSADVRILSSPGPLNP